MATQWTDKENDIFINVMALYRSEIHNKNEKTVKKITTNYAKHLHQQHPILQDRTIHAVDEHLSYFDDLLAGVGSEKDYAIKDAKYYNTMPRTDKHTHLLQTGTN